MKKEKITIAGMDVEVQGEDISFSAVYDPVYSLDLIEQFILDAGSDNLGVFGGIYEGGIHCQQIPDEIAPCILTILESGESIKSYLEIGVAAGGSTFLFNHFFHPEKIVLIDNNKHPKAGLRAEVLKGIDYQEIIGCSDAEESIKAISNLNTMFDVILIDGEHHYQGVKLDTVLYLPFLRKGGFLILHDSVWPLGGIMRVVRELKIDPEMEFIDEFVTKKHSFKCGIALFRRV